MNQFILKCIQPERRLHIAATTKEMFRVSSMLYGGISFFGLASLYFPAWPEMDKANIGLLCFIGLLISIIYYFYRDKAPLWLALAHIPLGIMLIAMVVYLGHAPQSAAVAIVYVLSSSYLFHYVTKGIALFFLFFSMALYSVALIEIGVEGWPAIVVFATGNCLTLGFIVWLITKRMHALNIKDSLTGLLNRQTIDAITKELIELSQRNKSGFSFIVIDLNKFKTINDSKGHLEGDKVLKNFSLALQRTIDSNDYVARWGGDEFIVILRDKNEDAVQEFENTLREATKILIGFELGVSYPIKDDSIDSLMQRADKDMYVNKQGRRATD